MRITFTINLALMLVAGTLAYASDSPLVGTWNCANIPDTGAQNSWNLTIREDNEALTGTLSDGEVEFPVSNIQLKKDAVTFHFTIRESVYDFKGNLDQATLEGKYSGEESGTLRCQKP